MNQQHDEALDRLIAGNDLDELIREVDRRTDANDWDGLVRLRDRCRTALERGFQLWPASSLAEYRIALRAPASIAARVIVEGAGRFALGPLPEVAASTHTWDELAAHLVDGPLVGVVAHERVVRGERLDSSRTIPYADLFDLPLALEAWEPRWPVATYRDDKLEEPRPQAPRLDAMTTVDAGESLRETSVTHALRNCVSHWAEESNGTIDVVAVNGTAEAAIASCADATAVRVASMPGADALAQVAWAAASGGAHGRRRGAAVGRDRAWELARALNVVGEPDRVRWLLWDEAGPEIGWHLRIAIEDPTRATAWALRALDEKR